MDWSIVAEFAFRGFVVAAPVVIALGMLVEAINEGWLE